jgi:ribonuclease BN (tRNA processing enzyme)
MTRSFALLLLLGCGSPPKPAPPQTLAKPTLERPASGTQIVILGSGTPVSDPDRFGPSVAIVVGDVSFIVDAGVGVVRRAAATKIPALKTKNLKRVFITHLHSDHTLGLPDLMLSGAVLHREAPIAIWGPHGLREMTDHVFAAWKKDIDLRVRGLERGDAKAYAADVHEIEPGVVHREGDVTVRAFKVNHGSWDEAFGYRFETPGRTIVLSGDTAPADSVIHACDGCDVLVHEVYATAGFEKLPAEDRAYHSAFHTSGTELAAIATKARAKLLVLHHQLFFGASEEQLLDEVKRGFSGEVISARDLQTL